MEEPVELKLFPAWKNAVKTLIASGLTYGSVVTKTQLVTLCELTPPTKLEEKDAFDLQLMGCIANIKEQLLLAHQMLLVSNHDGSYRIVHPKDQTDYAVATGTKAIAKEITRMALNVQHTNTALLDHDQRRRNTDAQAKIAMLAGMTQKSKHDLIGTGK